jgi:hypothetical protein
MNAAEERPLNQLERYREPEKDERGMPATSSMNLAMKRDWLEILGTAASYARWLENR